MLVNFISDTEGVGYLEARQIIAEFVDETWSKLENGEKIVFQQIGSLQYDRNEKLIFEADVHENFLLDAYGMEGFQFPQIVHKELIATKRTFTDKEAIRPAFGSRKVKALVVGIPILLALIFIPVSKYSHIGDSGVNLQSSNTTSLPMSGSIVPSVTACFDSTANKGVDKEVVNKVDTTNIQPKVAQLQSNTAVIHSDARYHLIGGCFKMQENADNFRARLQASGFKSEIKTLANGTFIVIVQSYADKNEATTALKALREAEPETGYWMSVN